MKIFVSLVKCDMKIKLTSDRVIVLGLMKTKSENSDFRKLTAWTLVRSGEILLKHKFPGVLSLSKPGNSTGFGKACGSQVSNSCRCYFQLLCSGNITLTVFY